MYLEEKKCIKLKNKTQVVLPEILYNKN